MPKVSLIHYTGEGHPDQFYAARLLAYTKNTRMNMTPDGWKEFLQNKPIGEILKEVNYMATTIPSSWEFVDVIFAVNDISRATAQQMTRTRNATFAMQSQRVSDMSQVTWDHGKNHLLDQAIQNGINEYSDLVEAEVPLEDARDALPIGVHCNLVVKYNLRSFVDLARARDSLRVQGPYVEVVRQMKELLLDVWPWAAPFFEPKDKKAIVMIETVARELAAMGGEQGAMYKGLSGQLAKAADLLKK
jgi:thymidylate synthase ThyX